MKLLLLLLGSYLIGAIPCGYLIGKMRGVDITHHGSGNIGTTNVFRILGPGWGLLVFAGDLAKGLVPALIGKALGGPGWAVAAGLAAVAGHNWSLFLGFRGGRGVATGGGVVLALMPKVVLVAFMIWLLVVFLSGYISLGSIIGALSVPIIALFFGVHLIYYVFILPVPLIILYRHLPNIRRLRNGTEPRIRFR